MGAGNYGGFGRTEGSTLGKTIDGNAAAMSKEYPLSPGGYFAQKGNSAHVRVLKTEIPQEEASRFFGMVASGGFERKDIEKRYSNISRAVELDDGTILIYRVHTSTPGSPAVDINVISTQQSRVKTQKIYFVKQATKG